MPYVVDANVPIVANGSSIEDDEGEVSIDCRLAAVEFLQHLLSTDKIVLDDAGEIQTEYRRHLNPAGQPGVGDRFLQEVLNSSPQRVLRVALPKLASGEYQSLPMAVIAAGFDPSDRKYAALAKQEQIPVANAVDSDWVHHLALLTANGIDVHFVCGCNAATWFE